MTLRPRRLPAASTPILTLTCGSSVIAAGLLLRGISEGRPPGGVPRSDPVPAADTPSERTEPDPGRWWALVVLAAAQLMIILDASIVNIALPSAQADLGISNADRQWMVTAYTLSFGALLLLGGRIADYTGR